MGWAGNTDEELDSLVGAKIIGFDRRDEFVCLHVRYRDGLKVNYEQEGFYEIWQDEEGNGPGQLVLVGHEKENTE